MSGAAVTTAVLPLLLLLLMAAVHGDRTGPDCPVGEHRLPRDTRPIAYELLLAPSYDEGSGRYVFAGHVEILIAVDSITPNVTLNAADMVIKNVAVVESETQKELEVDNNELVADDERLIIYMAGNLLAGRRYEVKIAFNGYLRPDMTGFYRSVFTQNSTTTKYA